MLFVDDISLMRRKTNYLYYNNQFNEKVWLILSKCYY